MKVIIPDQDMPYPLLHKKVGSCFFFFPPHFLSLLKRGLSSREIFKSKWGIHMRKVTPCNMHKNTGLSGSSEPILPPRTFAGICLHLCDLVWPLLGIPNNIFSTSPTFLRCAVWHYFCLVLALNSPNTSPNISPNTNILFSVSPT